jgi:hypothetical protein
MWIVGIADGAASLREAYEVGAQETLQPATEAITTTVAEK